MGVIQRVKKPSTHRGKKALLKREPKLVENRKQTLFIKGAKTNPVVVNCMKDLYHLKKPAGKLLGKRNEFLPFENVTPVEQFSMKHDASLFMFASHNKKRPNNLTLGRMFDGHLLDMVELGIEDFKSLQDFKNEKIMSGMKPCLLFCGELFEHNYEFKRLKSLLIDMFQNDVVDAVRLAGIEHVLMFTAAENKVYMRSYRIVFEKSGSRTPRVELEEIGPSVDFKLRRTKLASDDLYKRACRKPKGLKGKKVKNISKDGLGTQHGRIHIPKQEIGKVQTRKMKGLKKTPEEKAEFKRKKRQQAKEARKKQKTSEGEN